MYRLLIAILAFLSYFNIVFVTASCYSGDNSGTGSPGWSEKALRARQDLEFNNALFTRATKCGLARNAVHSQLLHPGVRRAKLVKRVLTDEQVVEEIRKLQENSETMRIALDCGEFSARGPHGAHGDPPDSRRLGEVADEAIRSKERILANQSSKKREIALRVGELARAGRRSQANRYQDVAERYAMAFDAYWEKLEWLHRKRIELGISTSRAQGPSSEPGGNRGLRDGSNGPQNAFRSRKRFEKGSGAQKGGGTGWLGGFFSVNHPKSSKERPKQD